MTSIDICVLFINFIALFGVKDQLLEANVYLYNSILLQNDINLSDPILQAIYCVQFMSLFDSSLLQTSTCPMSFFSLDRLKFRARFSKQ